jgi:hypothetical protein
MTTKTAEELIPLTKSWSNPAELEVDGDGFESEGYDATEMAYHLNCKGAGKVKMTLNASEDSPLVNPAFVIKNWGESDIKLKLNGKELECGEDYRVGHRYQLESTDLIVWIRYESDKATDIVIEPAD